MAKEGRSTHIFNPSAFALALFSIALLLTGRSDITWGQNIAITQFYPPQMYLMLFLIGLPGQLLFGVTSMTMAAVVTTYLFGLLYSRRRESISSSIRTSRLPFSSGCICCSRILPPRRAPNWVV